MMVIYKIFPFQMSQMHTHVMSLVFSLKLLKVTGKETNNTPLVSDSRSAQQRWLFVWLQTLMEAKLHKSLVREVGYMSMLLLCMGDTDI